MWCIFLTGCQGAKHARHFRGGARCTASPRARARCAAHGARTTAPASPAASAPWRPLSWTARRRGVHDFDVGHVRTIHVPLEVDIVFEQKCVHLFFLGRRGERAERDARHVRNRRQIGYPSRAKSSPCWRRAQKTERSFCAARLLFSWRVTTDRPAWRSPDTYVTQLVSGVLQLPE